ncbi:MAG: aminopeptidase P family protein [Alphaproteobacteria bacterium]|nr:aminopeptidase P family protein [Alphaproteobacteria bacterium]
MAKESSSTGRAKAQAAYQGDRALEGLLARSKGRGGVRYRSAREVRALLKGVLAAPFGPDPDAWLDLVGAGLGARLKTQLKALRTEMESRPPPAPPSPAERLRAVRARLKKSRLDGFIVGLADAHQGEYVPESEARLSWLTGFTGSAGLAVVMADKAALFVDGRYTLQARNQVDTKRFVLHHISRMPPAKWIAANMPKGVRLGFDPWLLTPRDVARFEAAAADAGAKLVPAARNPIDAVWRHRPAAPISPVRPLPKRFTGRSSLDKRQQIAAGLAARGARAAVLSAPDSIAWLLNIRGQDVEFAPLPMAFAVIARDGKVQLAIDPRKMTDAALAHLGRDVKVIAIQDLGPALDRLAKGGRRVEVDPGRIPYWIARRLARGGAVVAEAADPCVAPKAAKNRVELKGIRAAHLRDGAALTRFLAWFDGEAPKGRLTEVQAAAKVDAFRAANDLFQGLSFPTISGSGPNGAIVHYRATAASDRRIRPGDVFLLDSGGQYLDGTTDVTRTMWVGGGPAPNAALRDVYTRVLKGNIQLATVRFPAGTSGSQLDVLARRALWDGGFEYDHGTGHGVGHFLNVHEGPQRVSQIPNTVALEPGMVLSDEPGFYKTGAFGIRIETLLAVIPVKDGVGKRPMRGFETLTLAPIDRRLIDPKLLSEEERHWLNAYHARVAKALTPLLDPATKAWLKRAAKPI